MKSLEGRYPLGRVGFLPPRGWLYPLGGYFICVGWGGAKPQPNKYSYQDLAAGQVLIFIVVMVEGRLKEGGGAGWVVVREVEDREGGERGRQG